MADSPQVLNRQSLQVLLDLGLGIEAVADIVAIFRDDVPQRLVRVELAIQKGDLRTVEIEGHGLKGGTGNLGLEAFSALSRDLEKAAKEGRAEEAQAIMPQLTVAYGEASEAIREAFGV